jgi:cytochrome c oxidase cbb3-type subunit 3
MIFTRFSVLLLACFAPWCASGQAPGAQLPDAPNRETVQRICSGCHPAQIVLSRGMTREQWGGIVSNMISRGAKGSDEEFAQVVDYLTQNCPPAREGATAVAKRPASKGKPARSPSLIDQAGANDKHVVDEDAAARGKVLYTAQCLDCHGAQTRGGERGPDLVRSLVVLHDRYGDTIGPFLEKDHPNAKSITLTQSQIVDMSHFLHQQVGETLRTGPFNHVLNILVGDPKEGKAYFNGPGKCTQCHSTSGDLAHVASKYDPAVLQLKVVFPQTAAFGRRGAVNSRKSVTVTVTTAMGESATGVLEDIDDFNISLRDDTGRYRSFQRGPRVKVEKHDPYAAHVALLDEYTDKDIHDVVAYLETFK